VFMSTSYTMKRSNVTRMEWTLSLHLVDDTKSNPNVGDAKSSPNVGDAKSSPGEQNRA
jgi:hypothetical protein